MPERYIEGSHLMVKTETTSEDEIMLQDTEKSKIPSLQDCKDRFARFGECLHYHKDWIQPYGCQVEHNTCLVCAKQFEKRYLQKVTGKQIRKELLVCLFEGIKNKQVIYNTITDRLGAKRPSIRRVASVLKNDMMDYVEILSADIKYTENEE